MPGTLHVEFKLIPVLTTLQDGLQWSCLLDLCGDGLSVLRWKDPAAPILLWVCLGSLNLWEASCHRGSPYGEELGLPTSSDLQRNLEANLPAQSSLQMNQSSCVAPHWKPDCHVLEDPEPEPPCSVMLKVPDLWKISEIKKCLLF